MPWLAVGLAGIARCDRIAVLSRNRVEILEVYYASERHRAVCVPVNPSSGKASRLLLVRRAG